MDQSITQPNNLGPRYLAVLSAFVGWRSIRGFADDFQQSNKCEVELAIGVQVIARLSGSHRNRLPRVIEHMPKSH